MPKELEKFKKVFKDPKLLQRYGYVTISIFISAIVYNLLILPINLVTGGTGGISVITQKLFGIDPAFMIFVSSFFFLILSFIYLEPEDTVAALFMTLVYPFFVSITSSVSNIININTSNIILICIYSGIINGATNAIIYKVGLNTGGVGVVSKILYKYKHISQAIATTIINGIIVIVGSFVFGINTILYSAIFLYLTNLASDIVLLGTMKNKVLYIISDKSDEIKNFIENELFHDTTIFNTKGVYLNKKNNMIMTVIPSKEYVIVKEYIKMLDKKAFVFITNAYESDKQDNKLKKMVKNNF